MMWLGTKRGYFSDWLTQRWVQFTGKRILLAEHPWLAGPVAPTTGIGADYFASLAQVEGLTLHPSPGGAGVLPSFSVLRGSTFDPDRVAPGVVRFYEQTASYELDAWAQWCGGLRPFGWLLAILFSRRLQQLNVPLSSLDTSEGVTNEVLQFFDPARGEIRHTAWFRRLLATGNVLYAGFYSVCRLPGQNNPCVKVVFPLPHGNAIVIMRTAAQADGSFVVTSAGQGFGEPGFYFTVHGPADAVWARYVRSLRESIHVFPVENGLVRANHVISYFGLTFLRIHYRMRPTA